MPEIFRLSCDFSPIRRLSIGGALFALLASASFAYCVRLGLHLFFSVVYLFFSSVVVKWRMSVYLKMFEVVTNQGAGRFPIYVC